MTDETSQKKIIIDEDWKARAQAEKEALRMKAEQERAEQQAAPPQETRQEHQSPAADSPESDEADEPLPPPTFSLHVMSLASQAMMMLGQAENPLTGKVEVQLNHARHVIDTLAMLEQKTAGNLSAEEARLLTGVLHELRIGFVEAQRHSA